MKVEIWKISDIKPCLGNPRQNDAASIRRFSRRTVY